MRKKSDRRFVKGLVVGGGAASVVSLLLTPKTGAALRADLRRRGETWGAAAAAKAGDLRGRGASQLREARHRVAETLGSLGQQGSRTLEDVSEPSAGTTDRVDRDS